MCFAFAKDWRMRTLSWNKSIRSSAEGLTFSAVRFARPWACLKILKVVARLDPKPKSQVIKLLFEKIDYMLFHSNWGKHWVIHKENTPRCHISCSCTGWSEKTQSFGKFQGLLQGPLLAGPCTSMINLPSQLYAMRSMSFKLLDFKKSLIVETKCCVINVKCLLSWTSVQLMKHCQHALHDKHLGLSVDKPNAPKMNLQPCLVLQVHVEFHIDGFSMGFEAMCKKAWEMKAKLVVRRKPPNSTILRAFAEIKRPGLQIETIERFRRNGRRYGLNANVFVHTCHVEVFQHSLGSERWISIDSYVIFQLKNLYIILGPRSRVQLIFAIIIAKRMP